MDATLKAIEQEFNDAKVILKKYERQSKDILAVGRSEPGCNVLGKNPISPTNFVKSNEMIATSSFEISKRKNNKYVCYYCGKIRQIRHHCYKLKNDQGRRSTRKIQSNIATINGTTPRQQHMSQEERKLRIPTVLR
ncbi:hypothetical protein GOBAR_DD22413 [Gossypium barbadense]|nr:hypothetical protein GOBAR_DD22413 [Gossypium barbadense]